MQVGHGVGVDGGPARVGFVVAPALGAHPGSGCGRHDEWMRELFFSGWMKGFGQNQKRAVHGLRSSTCLEAHAPSQ